MNYIALLRGINVGGHSLIKMAELKVCLEKAGFEKVSTYIQSGNVFFSSTKTDELKLAAKLEKAIKETFALDVRTVVISQEQFDRITANAPKGWGSDPEWRYYLLFLLPPYDVNKVIAEIGEPKPDIEFLVPGDGVVYQASDMRHYGKTTMSRLVGKPVYQQITIRNYNTGRKLQSLLDAML
jgi:uncharacterized protein (DUF1697 family)